MISVEVSLFTEPSNVTGSIKRAAMDGGKRLLRSFFGLNHYIQFSHMDVGHCGSDDQGIVFQLQGPMRNLKITLCCL